MLSQEMTRIAKTILSQLQMIFVLLFTRRRECVKQVKDVSGQNRSHVKISVSLPKVREA